METVILILHVLVAVAVIGLIVLQQGKGAETGASFGAGASQSVFGSQGSTSFLSRTTAILATVFFITSIGLAVLAKQKAVGVSDLGIPSVPVEQALPDNDAPFSVNSPENATGSDAPVLESHSAKGGSSVDTKSVDTKE